MKPDVSSLPLKSVCLTAWPLFSFAPDVQLNLFVRIKRNKITLERQWKKCGDLINVNRQRSEVNQLATSVARQPYATIWIRLTRWRLIGKHKTPPLPHMCSNTCIISVNNKAISIWVNYLIHYRSRTIEHGFLPSDGFLSVGNARRLNKSTPTRLTQ